MTKQSLITVFDKIGDYSTAAISAAIQTSDDAANKTSDDAAKKKTKVLNFHIVMSYKHYDSKEDAANAAINLRRRVRVNILVNVKKSLSSIRLYN